jgi:hypothetical protein
MVYLFTAGEYTTGFPGTRPRAFASRAGGRKVRPVVLGSKSVSVLHVTLHASQKMEKGKAKVSKTKTVTFTAPRK